MPADLIRFEEDLGCFGNVCPLGNSVPSGDSKREWSFAKENIPKPEFGDEKKLS